MTSERLREPDDERDAAPSPAPETTTQAEPVGAQDTVATGDAAEGQLADDGQPTSDPTAQTAQTALDVSAGGGAAAAAATAAAVDATAADEPAVVSPDAAAIEPSPATTKPRRRTVFIAGLRRVLGFAFAVLLFAGGAALGLRYYEMNRPAPTVTTTIDPAATPPAVAQEFIRALASNDADALRSSLDQQPHKDITDEMTRFGIHRVQRIETLKTEVDGTRSATEIMVMAENADGLGFGINLVILVDGGKIEGFR